MRRLSAPLTALFFALLLAVAPAAQAGWFGADSIDGPAEIDALGDLDVARDGTGGIVYVKRDAGVPQVFLSRLSGGAWQTPEKLSSGGPVSEATVTATDGGRLAAAWVAGGEVWGTVIPAARQAQAPAPPVILGSGGASGVSIDMGINEDAYAVWAAAGDIHAARLHDTAWTPLAGALDLDPARTAGEGPAQRPRVAVSAEGNAVATWVETDSQRRTHVVARRLTRLTPSSAPQDLTLDAFNGEPGGNADSPDVDIEDDGSFAWVAFREDIGGRSRTVARRLRGSLFEDPFPLDGGTTSTAPRIDFAGKGIGGAVAAADGNAVFSDYLNKFDEFDPPQRMDAAAGDAAPAPTVAASERGDVYVAWRTGAGGAGDVRARRKENEKAFEPEFLASNPAYGAVAPGALAIASDRLGNTAVAMKQGSGAQSRITAAVWDRPPGRPGVIGSAAYRGRRPSLRWMAGSEIWGRQTFTVRIDGKVVGTTTGTQLVSSRKFGRGRHRAVITATDRRGQAVPSRTYTFRIDPGMPTLQITVRRRGRRVSVSSRAGDRGPSGLRYVEVDWGDGSRTRHRNSSHVYKKGRYTLRVSAVDRADNATVKSKALRIP